MMCEACNRRTARMAVTVLFSGKTMTRKLCPQCAQTLQRGDAAGLQAAMLGMMDDEMLIKTPACATCGWTLDRLCRSGMVGCSACYQAFAPALEDLYTRMNGKQTPKQEETVKEEKTPDSALDALRQELYQAVMAENYERAATLRDEIRALENKGGEAQSE